MTLIATQTFGLKKEFTEDLTGTIKALHGMGFTAIEPFILFNEEQGKTPGNLWTFETLKQAKQTMDVLGMRIPSAHIGIGFSWFSMPVKTIVKNILRLKETYGIDKFIVSAPFGTAGLAKHWGRLTKKISDAVHPHGCTILYHNHDDEFKRVKFRGTEVEAMQVFLDHTSPDVRLQVDIGWAHFAGDESEIIRRYADRIELIHLKDFYPEYLDGTYDRNNLPDKAFAPIGEGGIRTDKVLSMLGTLPHFAGAVIIDQDKYAGNMLDSLRTGCANIRKMLGVN